MELKIYNTMTRRKELFKPLVNGAVGLYVCGPTVYGHSHLGHAKSYISFDFVYRWLLKLDYKVRYVQNITDVGHLTDDADEGADKIEEQAKLEKIEPMEIVENYTRSYFEDMDRLNNLRPNISPRASAHMIEQIEVVKKLLAQEYAYEKDGNVYFDVHRFKDYGKLSGKKLEDLESGVRITVAEGKKHSADFALWKKAEKEHLMRWPSPWGDGYPGWHLECSTMSTKYLGETFDIHGGGLENVFPHHECEIAQAESIGKKPFVRYWMHNNMVTVDGIKMGKSLGNYVTLKDIFKKFDPMTIRIFVLQSHYRSPLDFSDAALEAAESGWHRIIKTWEAVENKLQEGNFGKGTIDISPFIAQFTDAMNDDFNTPQALAVIFDLIREVNRLFNEGTSVSQKSLLDLASFFNEYAGEVLGILKKKTTEKSYEAVAGMVEMLLSLREEFRINRDFSKADQIRDQLLALKINVKDSPDGTGWEIIE